MREGQFVHPRVPIREAKEAPKPEILSDKRQQDKIVAALESGNVDLISERQIDVQKGQREGFLQKVAKGDMSESQFQELILNIKPPIAYEQDRSNPVELYGFVSGNKQMRGLIAKFARGDFNQRDNLSPKDLVAFLQKYPEPSSFKEDAQGFLDEIEKENSPQKRQEYESSLREFMHIVYGKRQEYYDQIKLLRAEADAKYPELAKERGQAEARGDEAAEAVDGRAPVQEPFAASPRRVEQSSAPPQEKPMPPETAEFLRSHVIDQDLAYQDAILPEEVKQRTLDWSRKSESTRKYADSIVQLSQRANLETLRQTARELVQTMSAEAARLGIPLSPYGRSNTWAMWDIGKQNYFFTHQAENNPAYEIGDPLTSEKKREEIINRHLGWEAYATFRGDATPEWKQKIMSDRKFANVLELLNRPPKQNNTLSSRDLAELGKTLREAR